MNVSEMNKYHKYLDDILARLDKLEEYDEYANLTMPKPDTDEGDEFVRKELIDMYSLSDERDKIPLEYVIRLVSTPSQWADFYNINQLKNVYAIGE